MRKKERKATMDNISGMYEVTVSAMGKSTSGTMDLRVDGNRMEGSVRIIGQEVPIENGKASGGNLSGHVHADTPMGRLKLRISATADGETISGKIKALVGTAEFEGHRVCE